MGCVDLHLHTDRSDGEYAPAQVIRLAAEAGVRLVSVTDHDSTDGIEEGRAAAAKAGVEFIPGIEITSESEREQHILGYLIDIDAPDFRRMCGVLMEMRNERIERVFAYLRGRGVCLSRDEVAAGACGGYIGRPHIAAAMARAGYADSVEDAFARYLTGPEFRKTNRPKPAARESIEAIRSAGGVAVLAHPHSLRSDGDELDKAIGRLKTLGLGGLECYYGTYGQDRSEAYRRLAEKYGLVITGGSDFHGPNVKPDIKIGSGRDHLLDFNDMGVAERLRAAALPKQGAE
jgi:predicted metal-dependent phosphoesterase TrpH